MNQMKKTVIPFILTICMLWTMIPFVAGEASGGMSYAVRVNGILVNDIVDNIRYWNNDNTLGTSDSYNFSYNKVSKTLTLKDAYLTTTYAIGGVDAVIGALGDGNLEVVLIGDNSISNAAVDTVGILIQDGTMSISGTELSIDAGSKGIYGNGDITVDDCNLDVSGGSIGIELGSIDIVEGTTTVVSNSVGVSTGAIDIIGGEIEASGGNAAFAFPSSSAVSSAVKIVEPDGGVFDEFTMGSTYYTVSYGGVVATHASLAAKEFPVVQLGSATFSSGYETYQFNGLTVESDYLINTAIISANVEATTGETIDLSTATSPAGTSYIEDIDGRTKTLLFSNPVSAVELQAFLRDITFGAPASGSQRVTITADANTTVGVSSTNQLTAYEHEDGTTHYYAYDSTSLSWINAYNTAKAMYFMGMKGYLVTITSPDENQVLKNISDGEAWSGGARFVASDGSRYNDLGTMPSSGWVTDSASAAAYYWTCGPESGLVYFDSLVSTGALNEDAFYSQFDQERSDLLTSYPWAFGEPNDMGRGDGSGEWLMQVNFINESEPNRRLWNDLNSGHDRGFFVEFSGYDVATAVTSQAGLTVRTDPGNPNSNLQDTDYEDIVIPSSGGGSSTGGSNTANVLVNGVSHNAGSVSTSRSDGQLTKTLTVDTNRLQSILNSQPTSPQVVLPISGNNDVSQGVLTGQMVKNMEDVEAVLNVETDQGRYILPASDLDVTGLSTQFGEDVNLDDMEITVKISKLSDQQVTAIENTGSEGGWTLMIPPVEFQVEATYNGQTMEVNQFRNYVKREIPIPAGVDPMKITTAVVIGKDGKETHVPTEIFLGEDGLYYARIHSLTNSVYALVYHDMSFDDAVGLWYESTVNEMASRMILKGRDDGRFDGDAPITRAEFAATMVRALGLTEEGNPSFSDISGDQWFAGAVAKASQYGIIQGVGEGRFDPMSHITRQDAMVMIYRSAKIADYLGDSGGSTTTFGDEGRISEYAREAVTFHVNNGLAKGDNGQIRPLDSISRAETATLILRFLQKAELVDTRLTQ